MPIDPTDSFYQQLDAENLLNRHGKKLTDDARQRLAKQPNQRLAGMILTHDSREAPAMRKALGQLSGQPVPVGDLICLVPRELVEQVLMSFVGEHPWKEQAWQPQQMLPVVVSTRDGFKFGFFGLGSAPNVGDAGSH